jgi:hypothetical protein
MNRIRKRRRIKDNKERRRKKPAVGDVKTCDSNAFVTTDNRYDYSQVE